MNGTLVNGIAIIVGSIIGIVLKSGFIKAKSKAIMGALGLSTLIIGFQGVINYANVLLLIVALALGVLMGEFLKLDDHINHFAYALEKRFAKGSDSTFAQGFVTASILQWQLWDHSKVVYVKMKPFYIPSPCWILSLPSFLRQPMVGVCYFQRLSSSFIKERLHY